MGRTLHINVYYIYYLYYGTKPESNNWSYTPHIQSSSCILIRFFAASRTSVFPGQFRLIAPIALPVDKRPKFVGRCAPR